MPTSLHSPLPTFHPLSVFTLSSPNLISNPPQSIPCSVPSLFYLILSLTHILLAPYPSDLLPASFHAPLPSSLPDPFDPISASPGITTAPSLHQPMLPTSPYSFVPGPSDLSSLPRHPWWIMAPAYPSQSRYPHVWALGDCTSGALQPGPPPSLSPLTQNTTRRVWGQAAHGDPSLCPLPRHTSYWRLARTPASPASL